LEAAFPVLMAVDLAVAERIEQPLDFRIANRASKADAVDVVDRHEHRRFVRHDPEMIKTAGGAENCFFLDARYDAEPLVWVDDLVSDLECHVGSPYLRWVSEAL